MPTNTLPSWKIELNERIRNFSKTISVEESKVREIFNNLGIDGESEQSLEILESDEALPMSDLFKYFVDSGLAKIAKVRLGNKDLRGKHQNKSGYVETTAPNMTSAIEQLIKSNRPKNIWSDEELLNSIDDPESEKILRSRTHGRHCIVYNSDGSINKTISLILINGAKKQITPDTYLIDGTLVKVRRVGDVPEELLSESPFSPNTALFMNVCSFSHTTWSDVSDEVKILCRLQACHVENGKLSKTELRSINHDALTMSLQDFRKKYMEASLMYDDLKLKDNLPKLKIRPNNSIKSDSGF